MKTKTFKRAAILIVPICLALASSASAGLTVTLYQNAYSSGVGGEFTAVTSDPSLLNNYSPLAQVTTTHGTGFETFCIEYNIEFYPGVQYNAAINGGAIPGGGGTTGGNGITGGYDPISIGTAWLYSQFAAGTLANYDYSNTSNRKIDAGQLQNVFWYLENEIPSVSHSDTNPFYQMLLTQFGSIAAAQTNSDGAYGVAALNLTDCNGGYHQSQLVETSVPEPSTVLAGALILLPLGISTVRILRKKQFSTSEARVSPYLGQSGGERNG